MNIRIRWLGTLLVVIPTNASTQSPVRFEITPQVAYFAPQEELGAIARIGEASVVRLDRPDPGVALLASVQAHWPSSRLRVRLTGLMTTPLHVSGEIACMPGQACLAIFRGTNPDMRVAAALGEALLIAVDHDVIRPYALLGAGLKRFSFSWDETDPSLRGASHVHALAIHAGVGLELELLGASIRAEFSDYYSPSAKTIAPLEGSSAESVPGRRAQHDLSFSVGYRLFRF